MGVNIADLLEKKEIGVEQLSGKVLAVDAHLWLYQFLSTIRQQDGTPLMDSQGNITSHLSGIFSRSLKLMQKGLRLAFVFDGTAPKLKKQERERRKQLKQEASRKYEEAAQSEDLEAMRKYAKRTSHLTKEMVLESKELVKALGMPVVEAPSEGEAQASQLVKEGSAYAVASQDADSLLFGAPRLIRNLSLVGKRKKTSRLAYEAVQPELVTLSDTLNTLGITQKQLICLGMLVGTDFNQGGIKGIGPKNALKLVKKHREDFPSLFREAGWENSFSTPWEEVFSVFTAMPAEKGVSLSWDPPDVEKVRAILVERHEFSEERLRAGLERLEKEQQQAAQKGLGDFF